MDQELNGRVVVITGASSGIGRATALRCAREGAAVVVGARRKHALDAVAEDCRALGARSLAVACDVTHEGAVGRLARAAWDEFGRIDVWVNCAAVTAMGTFEQIPPESFRRVVETNLFGYVHGIRAALPLMRRQGHGTIINIGSMTSRMAEPFGSPYGASKAAVLGLSESVRMELAARGSPIQVCCVLPATIDTPFFQNAANYSGREIQAMPPVYPPEQVADTIVRAIHHPRAQIAVGNSARLMIALHDFAPDLSGGMIGKLIDKLHFGDRLAEATEGNLHQPLPGEPTIHGGWGNGRGRRNSWSGRVVTGLMIGGAAALLFRGTGRRQRHPAGAPQPSRLARTAPAFHVVDAAG